VVATTVKGQKKEEGKPMEVEGVEE